jgi:hypothetical protein
MNLLKKVSLVLALCALTVGVALAQQSVVISGTDGSGSGSVTIGIHPAATGGIDAALGEYGLPPYPPTFDIRCVSLAGWDTLGIDGVRNNYHKQNRETQTDRYKISIAPEVGGSPITVSWPSNMATVYGGYWRLLDADGIELCDMTTQPNYVFQTENTDPMYFIIVKADGKSFHTATWMDLANAVDSKLKGGKAEKRKNLRSEGEYSFTNSTNGNDALYVEFSQAVNILELAPFDKMTNADGKKKKWIFEFTSPTDTLENPETVTMFAQGDKGKELVAKTFWWIPAVPPLKWKGVKAGPVNPGTGTSRLQLNMPNWTNVGEELFLEGAFPEPNGLLLGSTVSPANNAKGVPIYRYVIMPKKYGAVYAALNKKGTTHAGGAPVCFETFATKPVVKLMKGYAPDKQKNELVAALIAMKFNMAASQYGHTNAGFGALAYKAQVGDPVAVDGQTVAQIATLADAYLTNCPATPVVTGAEFVTVINNINAAFSGTFDTTSFGVKTVVKPARAIMAVDNILYRTTLANVEPVITPNYNYETTPVEFALNQNYPNPFNPTTTISFDLSADAFVSLKVYNMLGQEVATLIDREEYTEGSNEVKFDASALSSGVYYYRLIVNDGEMHQVQKMMLLK